jgi:hypothetical protein
MLEYTGAWIICIVMFFAIEGPALINKRYGDTLSEHIWKWFSVKEKSGQWRLRRFCLIAILSWLSAHLLSGGQF